MSELTDLTLAQVTLALREGEFSSRELTQACLERIDRLEPDLHAFITLTPESALSQADQADQRLAAWRREPAAPISPLLGVPVAVKDVLCVAGVRCTCGSRILENFLPPYNATAVERLLAAGVVILGKTNTDEFAMGSSTENSAYGPTHNPWDLNRAPGGSSGGSAAAIAARMAPLALGTDTGGSVRQPASFCGVTGVKPTYGRVSRYGLIAYGSSLDVVGALGRSAADVAQAFSVMAGYDPQDATCMELPVPEIDLNLPPERALSGLRIGVPDEYFIAGIQAEVETAVREAVSLFESHGALVEPVSLPHTEYALPVYYLIAPAEASANLARYDGVRYGPRLPAEAILDVFKRTRGEKFGPEVQRRIMLGTYALSAGYYDAYYGQAQKVRTLIKRDFETAFGSVDLIAAPVAPTTAFPIGGHGDDPLAMYLEDVFTLPANLAGVPGLAFPVGFDSQGLPVGLQLMAPHFREDLLFRAAHAYQGVTDWHLGAPPLSS
jgi:aspartyl-tRNA(Asn)/glutamyl-tRNA(Gln) amidotransferase subunit A